MLTQENYYDKSTDKEYMSFSVYKMFLSNPARALADLKGEYNWFTDNKALLIGQYLHSYFESPEAHEKFKIENKKAMISTRGASEGNLKKEFEVAQKMIDRLEAEPQFLKTLQGTERERIVTGKIGDLLWKGKLDAVNIESGYFVDFKTVRSLVNDGAEWSDEANRRVNFIESRKYDKQMAVYAYLLEQEFGYPFTPIIWAVSKANQPLAKPYIITEETKMHAINSIKVNQEEIKKYIDEEVEAPLLDDGSDFYNWKHRVSGVEDYQEI